MKKSVLHFFPTIRLSIAFYLCLSAKNAQIILVFFCGWFSSVSYASPPPTNDVHICEVLDYEAMRARDSLYAATKQALNLNVGEPRTVRMIYFLPNDRPFQQEVVDKMKVTIRQVQTFFADQMEAHGHGRKTFRFETDAQGDPVVHRVDGQYTADYYLQNSYGPEIGQKFDTSANNVYLNIMGVSGGGGYGGGGRDGGSATVFAGFHWKTVAHELGHAFGLGHDWRDGNYIMSYGAGGSGLDFLSACAAEFLSVHPYFDPDIPDEGTSPPTIELISSPEYPTGSTSVSIQLKVSDPDGLHQVLLFNGAATGLKACRNLNGETNAVVQFDYDGVIPSYSDPQGTGTSLSDPPTHLFYVEAVDTGGNVGSTSFSLVNVSTRDNVIATFGGGINDIQSISFSPDGTMLAYGGDLGIVRLWDVAVRETIATLEGHRSIVLSVAFSPDGTLFASGSWDGTVKLWNVSTRRIIATLEHTSAVYTVSFSPDGKILASGSENGTVELWDVATHTHIATLGLHASEVTSVAFSPDGKILASGGGDGDKMVRLWDVATRTNITSLGGEGAAISDLAFSPDGSVLAFGGGYSWTNITLWGVATRTHIATLEGHRSNVLSVAFSPDGTTLVSGSSDDGTIRLWNVGTGGNIMTFGVGAKVSSIAFSPDGKMAASGFYDGTMLLWDMSPYITPSTPTPVPTPDFDGDGIVGVSDFLLFVDQFGFSRSDGGYEARFDLDGDGVIGVGDFLIFVNDFGKKVS